MFIGRVFVHPTSGMSGATAPLPVLPHRQASPPPTTSTEAASQPTPLSVSTGCMSMVITTNPMTSPTKNISGLLSAMEFVCRGHASQRAFRAEWIIGGSRGISGGSGGVRRR